MVLARADLLAYSVADRWEMELRKQATNAAPNSANFNVANIQRVKPTARTMRQGLEPGMRLKEGCEE
jgi:hypothetical protein